MKKIEAIIKPFKLEGVREALIDIGVEGVTVSEVKMLGRHPDHTGISRGRRKVELASAPRWRGHCILLLIIVRSFIALKIKN